MSAQNIRAVLFLDKLVNLATCKGRQNQLFQSSLRNYFGDEIFTSVKGLHRNQRRGWHSGSISIWLNGFRQAICENVVPLCPLFRNDRLSSRVKTATVAAATCLDE
jgi:hypothetical protein